MGEILSYLKIIRKWWWVIVLLNGATIGTMLAIVFLGETEYEATVTVQVSAPPPQEVPLYSQFGRQALRDEIEQTRAGFNEFLVEGDVPYRTLEALPDIKMQGGELHDKITVDIPEDSQLMKVRVRTSDSKTAALLANTLVEIGLEAYGQLLAQPTANTRRFIEQQLGVTQEDLQTIEARLIQFQIDNKVGSLNNAIDSQYDFVRSLKFRRDIAQAEGNIAEAQAIDEIILEREAELQNMMGLATEYNELIDRVERVRATHDFLLDKRAEAQIKENQILELGSIQIITPARPPKKPTAVINNKIIVLGTAVSLLVSVLLVFLLEYLQIAGILSSFQMMISEQSEMIVPPSDVREQVVTH